jgi:DNA-directed RNA polymerase alpha subunit
MNYTKENNITPQIIEETFSKFSGSRKNGRIPEILKLRLEGFTLEQIAVKFSVTKERIRQMEAKGVCMITCGIEQKKDITVTPATKIKELQIKETTKHSLLNYDIKTIADLTKMTANELLEFDGIGHVGLTDLCNYLDLFGIKLAK